MNERIKQLAEQARHWAHFEGLEQNPRSSPDILFEQKFAELIIKEAGEAFWSSACNVSDLAYEEYRQNSKKIKQHFGVKL